MGSASINVSVVETRMFSEAQAADYVGFPPKKFKAICPVQPVELTPGLLRYD